MLQAVCAGNAREVTVKASIALAVPEFVVAVVKLDVPLTWSHPVRLAIVGKDWALINGSTTKAVSPTSSAAFAMNANVRADATPATGLARVRREVRRWGGTIGGEAGMEMDSIL
jgi:hypothetical protein